MTRASSGPAHHIGAADPVAAYQAKTPRSAELFERARAVAPAGTTGNLRYFPPYPLYMTGGRGAVTVDLDGNEYRDFFLCNGPLLLGHRHPAVEDAIASYRGVGSLVVNPVAAVELAEMVADLVPCAEQTRFLNSGTEAVFTAVRYARAHTGREKVVKFLGHYHGQEDQFLVGIGDSAEPFGAGIPRATQAGTIPIPYDRLDLLERVLAEHSVAAVILDPSMHAGGLWGSDPTFLRGARELSSAHGAVLIFDEVITGFRLALGGAQEFYGVVPDLVTLGKGLAAGEKLSAVAGRADVMACVDLSAPTGRTVFQSGTGNDGTVALAAAIGALSEYRRLADAGAYETLSALASRLADGITEVFAERGLGVWVHRLGPMLQMAIADPDTSFEELQSVDPAPLTAMQLALAAEGVLLSLPTSDHIYLSFAHTDADIEEAISVAGRVLDRFDLGLDL